MCSVLKERKETFSGSQTCREWAEKGKIIIEHQYLMDDRNKIHSSAHINVHRIGSYEDLTLVGEKEINASHFPQ